MKNLFLLSFTFSTALVAQTVNPGPPTTQPTDLLDPRLENFLQLDKPQVKLANNALILYLDQDNIWGERYYELDDQISALRADTTKTSGTIANALVPLIQEQIDLERMHDQAAANLYVTQYQLLKPTQLPALNQLQQALNLQEIMYAAQDSFFVEEIRPATVSSTTTTTSRISKKPAFTRKARAKQ